LLFRESRSREVHLYVVRTAHREELQRHLASCGIQNGIQYPIPIHLHDAYADLGYKKGVFPVTEKLAGDILSLPMFGELSQQQIESVLESIAAFRAN
jgi:dTDP-4-amino-4,6-dideoxygalactose transaminase